MVWRSKARGAVCGTEVDEDSSISRDVDVKTYYFCSNERINDFSDMRAFDSVLIQPFEHNEMLNKEGYSCYC